MTTKPTMIEPSSAAKGRAKRVMDLLEAMSQEERAELFDEIAETYCTTCAEELPDIDSDEPDHDCGEDEEEEGDEGEAEEDDAEEADDQNANES